MTIRLLFPTAIALGGGLAYQQHHRRPLFFSRHLCESPVSARPAWAWFRRTPPPPPPPQEYSGYSPTTYRQISTGSFFGVAAGLFCGRFGKAIAIVIGGVFLLIETLARQGMDLVPYATIRRWVGDVDVQGLILKNTAFKVSFGTAFVIAAFYA